MNLQQLQYIISLDQTGSFSVAARQCYVTQATLSTMVKKLEKELDVVLFDRKTNPVVTTECGKEVVEMARKAVHYADAVKEVALSAQNKQSGYIRLGIIPTIAISLLPLIIKPLSESYPDLKIDFFELTTENILDQLKNGLLDMAIISTPYPVEKGVFEEDVLYYEKLFVYGELFDKKKFLIPEEIKDHKLWLLEEGNCLRDQAMSLCSLKKKSTDDHLTFQTSSFETLLNLVDNFGGLTLLPELYIQHLSTERKKRLAVFKPPFPVREVSLIYHRPFAKHRLTSLLSHKIRELIKPNLQTDKLKSSEQRIVMV